MKEHLRWSISNLNVIRDDYHRADKMRMIENLDGATLVAVLVLLCVRSDGRVVALNDQNDSHWMAMKHESCMQCEV